MSTGQEFLWACELNAEKKEYEWELGAEPQLDDDDVGMNDEIASTLAYSLVIKRAILGADAAQNEINIVELESTDFQSDLIKSPIVRLSTNGKDQKSLDLIVSERSCKLRLIRGSGPVHLLGQLLVDLKDDVQDDNYEPSMNESSWVDEDEAIEIEDENQAELEEAVGLDVNSKDDSAKGDDDQGSRKSSDDDKPTNKLAAKGDNVPKKPNKRKLSNNKKTSKKAKLAETGNTNGSPGTR